MFKYNKHTNIITDCHYSNDYVFNEKYPPTINKIFDGNLITIGGEYFDTKVDTDKLMIYNTSNDEWPAGKKFP